MGKISSCSSEAITATRPVWSFLSSGRVGKLVKLLDLLALDVDAPGLAQDFGQPGPVALAGDDLASQRDVIQQVGQRAGRLGKRTLLLQDVPFDRDDLSRLVGFSAILAASLAR